VQNKENYENEGFDPPSQEIRENRGLKVKRITELFSGTEGGGLQALGSHAKTYERGENASSLS